MNEKQRRFADYYIETGNITESAIKAGYSENYANAQGYKLLDNVGIKSYIEERMKEITDKRILSQQEALELLTSISRGEMTEEQYIGTQKGVEKVIKTPDIKDRQKAIESILKRYPISKQDELNNKLLQKKIDKLEKELESDTSTEDKLKQYFEMVDDAFDE